MQQPRDSHIEAGVPDPFSGLDSDAMKQVGERCRFLEQLAASLLEPGDRIPWPLCDEHVEEAIDWMGHPILARHLCRELAQCMNKRGSVSEFGDAFPGYSGCNVNMRLAGWLGGEYRWRRREIRWQIDCRSASSGDGEDIPVKLPHCLTSRARTALVLVPHASEVDACKTPGCSSDQSAARYVSQMCSGPDRAEGWGLEPPRICLERDGK